MKQEKDGKTLYHVQSLSDYSDEPMDYFIWSRQEPTSDEIRTIVKDDFNDDDNNYVDEIVNNCNVYTVYTEEV